MLEITNSPQVQFKATYSPQQQQKYSPYQPLDRDMLMLQKAQKKEANKEKWYKAGVAAQIGLAVAFGIMAVTSILTHKLNKKAMSDGRVQNEIKELTGVNLRWTDFKNGDKKVAKLKSKTTAPGVQGEFDKYIKLDGLSESAKKYAGEQSGTGYIYLYGHSGTGKTYVSEQFAQDVDAIYTCIKYPDIGSPFKDAASIKINNIFKTIEAKAKENPNRKIVVCIDEVDALLRKVADNAQGASEAGKSRAAVLTGVDQLRKSGCDNVTVVLTSNYHPQSAFIDNASIRRFPKIEVSLGGEEQNLEMLKFYLGQSKAEVFKDGKFLNSPELKTFAKKLTDGGYSNGEIAQIVECAMKEFRASLHGVPDNKLTDKKFTIDLLEKGLNLQGEAASKTNTLMNITAPAA